MTLAKEPELGVTYLPDHTQLPESDGTFVKNFQEHPQSNLLSNSIRSVLQQLHPDGQYCIGQDCGIYWRLTDPPERGAELPWLRWWDGEGNLLLTGDERAELERQRAELERQRAERLADRLRQLGVNPDEL